jgi:sialic acid synthase SpsE
MAALEAGAPEVTLLQCTTSYPTAYPDVQLRAITALAGLAAELNLNRGASVAGGPVQVGFSDHSIGNWCCFGAVAMGARVIEKHICLDKSAPGPDIACSCNPGELHELVEGIRALEQALGHNAKRRLGSEEGVAAIARRGIYFSRPLPAGHVIEPRDLVFLRPAASLSPADAEVLLGQTLTQAVDAGEAAERRHLAGSSDTQAGQLSVCS